MSLWEARMRLVQAALDLASLQVDPFKETRDPHHGDSVELAEENLDHAVAEYQRVKAADK